MASYEVRWSAAAGRELRAIPADPRRRILIAVLSLADDPFLPGSRKLKDGAAEYRLRVGDYRVLYDVYRTEVVVQVLRVGHRREVYRQRS